MYDSVWVRCSCGQSVEFQSKAGRCVLADYDVNSAPADVLVSVAGETQECRSCGELVTIRVMYNAYVERGSRATAPAMREWPPREDD